MSAPIEIRRYEAADCDRWNDFCRTARNATFLFRRGFMDYHADRFTDCSLIATRGGHTVALLPADLTDGGRTLRSHGGLTYGGWILPRRRFTPLTMLEVWERALDWMRASGIGQLLYKPLPAIYAATPSQEDRYALFRCGGQLASCQLSATVALSAPLAFGESARQAVRAAEAAGLTAREVGAAHLPAFWAMLERCLAERHEGATPVHTLAEMTLLMQRFPEAIRLWVAQSATGELLAGTLLFDTGRVVHTQYIATTAAGRELRAFPLLVRRLIDSGCGAAAYLDFGTSADAATPSGFNEGLLLQKCGFGATPSLCEEWQVRL